MGAVGKGKGLSIKASEALSMKNLDYIIDPIDRNLLIQELDRSKFVRTTNKLNNEIYILNHHNAPNTMLEIGRLRELTFALSGGGTGNEVDIDHYDTSDNCYDQLIVWAPEEKEIVGGYRFIDCSKVLSKDQEGIALSTRHYFNFSTQFIEKYLPCTIELGRSWVQPNFQPSVNPRKGLFALDNLWDGLGALVVINSHIKHLFGKVTMYTNYHPEARDAVLLFMEYYFPDELNLVTPIYSLGKTTDTFEIEAAIKNMEFRDGLRILAQYVKERGESIPPLINNYMQLSPTMKTFGTAANPDFGDVEETGILLTIADIYEKKKSRHLNSYLQELAQK